jgi:integrase
MGEQKGIVQMRYKSKKYPGVYWRIVSSVSRPGQEERSYYAVYKKEGKTVEAKVGLQFRDDMTEARAAKRRSRLIEGKTLTPEEKRKQKKAEEEVEAAKSTMKKLWAFFERKKNGKIKSFSDDRGRWQKYLEPAIGDRDPNSITKKDIELITDGMEQEGKADATIRQVQVLFKRIVNLGVEYGQCEPLKFRIRSKKLNNERIRYLTCAEAKAMLEALRNNPRGKNTHDICLLSLNSGLRFGEIAALKWQDVNLEHGTIYISSPKNGQARTVFMNENVKCIFSVREQGEPGVLVFPDRKGNKRKQVSDLFNRTIDKLGFNDGISDSRHKVCFHSLRHTYASWAVQCGLDLFRVQKALGHSDSKMTERYSHLAPDGIKAVTDAVEAFQNGKIIPLRKAISG